MVTPFRQFSFFSFYSSLLLCLSLTLCILCNHQKYSHCSRRRRQLRRQRQRQRAWRASTLYRSLHTISKIFWPSFGDDLISSLSLSVGWATARRGDGVSKTRTTLRRLHWAPCLAHPPPTTLFTSLLPSLCCLQCFSLAMHIFPFFNLLLLLLVCFLSLPSLSLSPLLSFHLSVLLCPRLAEGKLFGVSSAAHQFLLLTSKSCNALFRPAPASGPPVLPRRPQTHTHTHTHTRSSSFSSSSCSIFLPHTVAMLFYWVARCPSCCLLIDGN